MSNTPKNYQEAKEQFEAAVERAKKNPQNKVETPKMGNYMMRDGIPHKFKEGRWIPLTKIN